MWEDNADDLICTEVRKYWNITAAELSLWNPSVGADCKPWGYQSYCVVPEIRLPATTSTVKPTTSTTRVATSTSTTLDPSPTAWVDLGCYVDANTTRPVLEKRISSATGDAALTIAKCKDACYKASLLFAGLKAGNQCWCSSFVAGELALNATECGTPCTGNATEKCGGKDRISVFEPVGLGEDYVPEFEDEGTVGSGNVISGDTHSSGANKYRAIF